MNRPKRHDNVANKLTKTSIMHYTRQKIQHFELSVHVIGWPMRNLGLQYMYNICFLVILWKFCLTIRCVSLSDKASPVKPAVRPTANPIDLEIRWTDV